MVVLALREAMPVEGIGCDLEVGTDLARFISAYLVSLGLPMRWLDVARRT